MDIILENFDSYVKLPNRYGGSELKISARGPDGIWMIKMPDPARSKTLNMCYINNHFSEFIGSTIFSMCGIPAQEVRLGTITQNGKVKTAVACKDFTNSNETLIEFKKLCLSVLEYRPETSIECVMETIDLSFDDDTAKKIKSCFWDMFVIDALIGNYDRHLENWGVISFGGHIVFSPVYDCGSSLHSMLSEEDCAQLLSNDGLFRNEVHNIASCYKLEGNRIQYSTVFNKNLPELDDALLRVFPKINIEDILNMIQSVPELSSVNKEFIIKSICYRYNKFLKPQYEKLLKQLKSGSDNFGSTNAFS